MSRDIFDPTRVEHSDRPYRLLLRRLELSSGADRFCTVADDGRTVKFAKVSPVSDGETSG